MNNSGSKVVIEAMANNAFESLLCKHHVELTNHVSIKQLEGCFKIKFYYLNNDSNENLLITANYRVLRHFSVDMVQGYQCGQNHI